MDATRHRLANEAISLNSTEKLLLYQAEQLELNGNWYLAGEVYRKIDKQLSEIAPETRAQLLVRAATETHRGQTLLTCFCKAQKGDRFIC